MSSNKQDSSEVKPKKSKSFGIIAIVKRKRSKKKLSVSVAADSREAVDSFKPIVEHSQSPSLEAASLNETESLKETVDFTGLSNMERELETQVEDLTQQLQLAQEDLDAAEDQIDKDAEAITGLKAEVQQLKNDLEKAEEKVANIENITDNLDDDSFSQAQEFQLKQEIEELQGQLEKRKNLEKELLDMKVELQEVRSQYEEIQFKENRSTTRNKMKSISEEKTTKEEVARLQKELRMSDRNLKKETSQLEAQLKASQDSMQRIQEKFKASQSRFDAVEKERLDLKIENSRLEKKLEKAGSYAERKRFQTEQETAELQMKNLKRKNVKLEKRLSMSTQMLDMIGEGSKIMTDGDQNEDGITSPIPQTLSEARIISLEKEVYQLEQKLSKMTRENESSKDNASSALQTTEVFTLKVKQLDEQLMTEKEHVAKLETEVESLRKVASAGSGEDYLASLQDQIKTLEEKMKEAEVKFHVKEKDLWSTVEAQKKQIQELEMEKLALELGEDEEGDDDDLTDTEEDTKTDKSTQPDTEMKERLNTLQEEIENLKSENEKLKEDVEMKEQLNTLQEEIENLKSENEKLKEDFEKKEKEAEEFMKSIESELETENPEKEEKEQQLINKNEELKEKIKEKAEQYDDSIREIGRLKSLLIDQETEITTLKREKQAAEQAKQTPTSNAAIPVDEEIAPEEATKVKKVKATGGIKMMVIPTKPNDTNNKVEAETPAAPSLTPKFKKPPPAPKKKPTRGALRKKSEDGES